MKVSRSALQIALVVVIGSVVFICVVLCLALSQAEDFAPQELTVSEKQIQFDVWSKDDPCLLRSTPGCLNYFKVGDEAFVEWRGRQMNRSYACTIVSMDVVGDDVFIGVDYGGNFNWKPSKGFPVMLKSFRKYQAMWLESRYVADLEEPSDLVVLEYSFPEVDLSRISSRYCVVEIIDGRYKLCPVEVGMKCFLLYAIKDGVSAGAEVASLNALKMEIPRNVFNRALSEKRWPTG